MKKIEFFELLDELSEDLRKLKPDGITRIKIAKNKYKWLVYDFTRGTPNDMGTAFHLSAGKESKESYKDLCRGIRKLFPKEEVKFIPLATTYEGTFDMPGWKLLGSELGWEEKTLKNLLQLTG